MGERRGDLRVGTSQLSVMTRNSFFPVFLVFLSALQSLCVITCALLFFSSRCPYHRRLTRRR